MMNKKRNYRLGIASAAFGDTRAPSAASGSLGSFETSAEIKQEGAGGFPYLQEVAAEILLVPYPV